MGVVPHTVYSMDDRRCSETLQEGEAEASHPIWRQHIVAVAAVALVVFLYTL